MIQFENFTLENGLRVIVHEDPMTQIAVLNILYNVGSRDENENQTGFAHLFEHLMFGGSENIPSYDEALQMAGGENNAFTSPDFTNYYLTLPSFNIETGFWLESDRMLSLSFDPHVLEVQRKVVVEEFKQRYLNQPYGDLWLKLRPLCYRVHPYRWPTIGKEIEHIENATMDQVKSFFKKNYVPNNATIVVAGNVKTEEIRSLSEKWFGDIPAGNINGKMLPQEPEQKEPRFLQIESKVPAHSITKAYHMPARFDPGYYPADLLSDILGRGKSSRLHNQLVQVNQIFSSINAYLTGSLDPGLLVIEGKLNPGVEMESAEDEISKIINKLKSELIEDSELEKVVSQAESTMVFSEVEILNRAMNLAFFDLTGDAGNINLELKKIKKVSAADIRESANNILKDENCSTLHYLSKPN
jgi:zinc protease